MSSRTRTVLKVSGLVLGGIALAVIVAVVVVQPEVSAERSIEIDRPADEVFEYVRHLRNQEHYGVWAERDPDMHQEYHGIDGTVGSIVAWEGNEEAGRGEQEIVGIIEGRRVDTELRFVEPFESRADSYIITESLSENRTRVTWGMETRMPRPLNLMLLFISFEDLVGDDYDRGLERLKEILESGERQSG